MHIEVLPDAEAAAARAAAFIAAQARAAVRARGVFCFAASGGRTPWLMLRRLADEDIPWAKVHLFQVDERVAPEGSADRNLTHIQESLLAHVRLSRAQVHAMPVAAADLEAAARDYAAQLVTLAGSPPVLDLVHLGLGADGHTASLVPGDAVLAVADAAVAATGPYMGHRRMTLTRPTLDRARCILWLVTGSEKAAMLEKLCAADASIPAGRIAQRNACLIADRAAGAPDARRT
ncbi:MAG TPA: 6-phosphogluconolactonase [Burkholderiaceae bacterium]|nr:6-phosphogluconolactonase [Burkholderiaceae bacterium]